MQRVSRASVTVDGKNVGGIERGLLILLGVGDEDDDQQATKLAAKVVGLRIFEDAGGKMNLDVSSSDGAVLCISQFTLYGDVRRGRRPSFDRAARPEVAKPLYEVFCRAIEERGLRCERGTFGAHMEVSLVNDGPVTLIVDTDDLDQPRRA